MKMKLILIIIQLLCFGLFAQTKPLNDSLFINGSYFEAINKYTVQLTKEKSNFIKAQLFQKIAECYYYTSYHENFKSYCDSSQKYYTKHFKKETIYDVEYQINLIRYYNFLIKAKEAYNIGLKAKRDLLKYPKTKYYKLYEVIGTNYRNYGGVYKAMVLQFDSAYYYLKTTNLLNTFDEVIYCRARANMELDLIKENDTLFLHYKNANIYYDKGISILKKIAPNNYAQLLVFYCLKGLSANMAYKYEISDAMFTKAYNQIQKNKTLSDFRNIQAVYLNIINWSSWTTNALFDKTKNINYKYEQLNKLLIAEKQYKAFAVNNKIKAVNLFKDTYNYAPYNSIVSCFYDIYKHTNNITYIDSALKYAELNKSQWNKSTLRINELNKNISSFTNDTSVVIHYSEIGFRGYKKIYAILYLKNKKHFIELPSITNDQEFPSYYDNTKISQQQYNKLSYNFYLKLFNPLETILPLKVKNILLIPSGTFSYINFEGIITDTVSNFKTIPFLLKKYNIIQQPSLSLFFNSNKTSNSVINTVSLLCPNYNNSSYSNIKYTSNLFNTWSSSFNTSTFDLTKKSNGILLVSAHCKSNVDNGDLSYIQLPDSNLSIGSICEANLSNKLTILAMCDGGFGENVKGSGNYNFSSAFMMAGSECCLYSIWKLEDKTASIIIADFLKNLEKGQSKDMALRNAKLTYLKNANSEEEYRPMYWASLQLVGNINPIIFKTKTSIYWWLLLPFIIGVSIVFRKLYLKKKST